MNIYFVEPNGITIHQVSADTPLTKIVADFAALGFRISGRALRQIELQRLQFSAAQPAVLAPTTNQSIH